MSVEFIRHMTSSSYPSCLGGSFLRIVIIITGLFLRSIWEGHLPTSLNRCRSRMMLNRLDFMIMLRFGGLKLLEEDSMSIKVGRLIYRLCYLKDRVEDEFSGWLKKVKEYVQRLESEVKEKE